MRKIYLTLLLVSSLFSAAQTEQEDFEHMIEAEMKSAASIQNFQVNPNTQNYDITYHELRFTVNPAVYNIVGQVATTFTALEDMNSIIFDLTDVLTVNSVMMGATSLTFSQYNTEELEINFPSTITNGSSATVVINYSGAPDTDEQAFSTSTHSGTPVIYTLSEPFGARDWWPCKQDLNDKIDNIDVYITCPTGYIGVTNGLLQSETTSGGMVTRHFHHGYPIPAYLISLNVTNYVSYNIQAGLGTTQSPFFPINNYLYPENNNSSVQAQIDQTVPIMNVFEDKFGPYPYRNEQYGHVQFGWGGGMEHATMSSMVSFPRSLIAHELGHQWFGNRVTCGTWKDIWLNEGLTEYTAGIVVEELDGATSFVSWKNSKINNITSQPGGALYLTDSEALNVNRIFSGRLSYNKGSMVTHMLRWVMGDTNFFQALQNYLTDPNLSYAYAITSDLQSHVEAVHGSSLNEFFNDWVYNQGYPSYDITVQNWGAGQVKITVNQTQSHASVSFFEMPLEIRLFDSGGSSHDVVVNNTFNGQEFIVASPFVVTSSEFDPNKHIISKNNNTTTLGNDTFDLNQSISLYPNPSNNILNVKLPNTILLKSIEIYNGLGQLVLKEENTSFSILKLNDGVYHAKIKTSEGLIHKNFIKK
ncbi:M1 family aminopeptidase [Flavobacterium okayamense]|uniref:Aminopeptidase N n=1 Tax=Flavobacterium okayamense TaxID=2830782 RepID=A0ABN6HV59_9FLAO|nr:M1 family aminopeptidase [Flavobacterium okayamense]BCY27665.1 peptidase M1 [Flavobacterium okayamense]